MFTGSKGRNHFSGQGCEVGDDCDDEGDIGDSGSETGKHISFQICRGPTDIHDVNVSTLLPSHFPDAGVMLCL